MDYYGNDNNGSGGFQNDPFSPGNDPSFSGGWDNGPSMNGEDPDHHNKNKRSRKPMSPKQKGAIKIVALCLVCALLGGLAQPIYSSLSGGNETTIYTGDRTPTQVDTASVDTSKELTTAEIYAKYVNSCVGITVDIVSTNVFGQTVTGAAAGSGFVITEDGYILTNYHVIDGANSIKVTFDNGKEYTATYVGGEEKNDIAVIKVDATGLTPVVIGKSSDMLVGEQVTTIGNPLGELTFSESTGIISALDRSITMSDGRQMNMIQTDCAINSGNSGGPLFNSHGEVIGIVSAKYSSGNNSSSASVEGLGFAIPMDDVANMVSDLVKNGYVTGKPIMGISVADVDESVTSYGVPQGAIIRVVTPDLCGAKAGLQAGDIVTKIDNTDVTSASDLTSAIGNYKPGDKVTLTIFRSGETKTVEVTLEESTPEKTEKQNQAQQEYQQEYQQSQQQQQQSQQQQQGSSGWPFGSFGY
jgi:serine protease Do